MKREADIQVDDDQKNKRLKSYESELLRNRLYLAKRKNSTNTNREIHGEIKSWTFFNNYAFRYDAAMSFRNISLLSIGEMDSQCNFCGAMKFKREWPSMCCANGKVKIEPFRDPPNYLKNLLDGNHTFSKHFLTNIRTYNNAFSFTSFGTSVKCSIMFNYE